MCLCDISSNGAKGKRMCTNGRGKKIDLSWKKCQSAHNTLTHSLTHTLNYAKRQEYVCVRVYDCKGEKKCDDETNASIECVFCAENKLVFGILCDKSTFSLPFVCA